MIDNIIAGYLSKNKRLVVPEFGAFIRKDSGELVFVEFLKKDDQILTSLVGREYELNESEAREAIEDYIRTVKRTVGQTGRYVIEGVGAVQTDANGLYALDYNPSARKESAPVQHAAVGEQFAEPEMEVINARDRMPAVGEEEPAEPDGNTIIFPVRSESFDTVAGLHTKEKESETAPPKEIEFRYREVTEIHETARKATINDLYTMPAGSRESGARNSPVNERPAGQPRAESQRQEGQSRAESQRQEGQSRAESQRQGGQPRPEQFGSAPRREPQRPAQQRPVNYSSATKKKIDLIMILAIAAAVIALGSVMYGVFVKRNPSAEIRPTQTENVEAQPPVVEGADAEK